ncbi:MAG: DegT/DnrJ/EryC1/StrS aminotransferase family protein [Chloroflexota bacterium]|nr:DegT/DnrJ/EryC1/StrS aminotransferase family protein [Chloroflexota bacterium]
MEWRVPLADLDYGKEEEQAVLEVLRSKWLTMGAVTRQFEDAFSKMTGSKHAIAVSNATEALHLACLVLGVGPGDEVIVPSLSFVATANAVLYCGAEVRFADIIGPEELTIDPASIAQMITPKTKAIIVMHYAGYPCRMAEIKVLADQHHIPIIEDAAHAPGASLTGKELGTWGDVGCFSFFSNKNLPTGEGGMVVCNRADLAEKIRLQRSHGMTSLTYDRHKGHAFSYDVVDLGFNYRIDEIRSALGLVQLNKLKWNNQQRRALTHQYWEALGDTDVGLPFSQTEQGTPAYHIFPILLPKHVMRENFMTGLRDAFVQSSIHYRPIHTFSYYQDRYGKNQLPVTEDVSQREVTLPLFPSMTEEQQQLVITKVKTLLAW